MSRNFFGKNWASTVDSQPSIMKRAHPATYVIPN